MIKAEVVFDGDSIFCNGIEVEISMHEDYEKFYVVGSNVFSCLEEAVSHCIDKNHSPKTTNQ